MGAKCDIETWFKAMPRPREILPPPPPPRGGTGLPNARASGLSLSVAARVQRSYAYDEAEGKYRRKEQERHGGGGGGGGGGTAAAAAESSSLLQC